MEENKYLQRVISRYVPKLDHLVRVKKVSSKLVPYIRYWAYPYFLSILPAGSFAKGTSIASNTDIDLFISLKPTLPGALEKHYKNFADWMRIRGFSVREQNVSIRVNYTGFNIDLIPGKRQPGVTFDHSIYFNKRDTWKKTNVKKHIKYVKKYKRIREIRAIKIWRNLNKLEFPSFYLELCVINALKSRSVSLVHPSIALPNNLLRIFEYLSTDFINARIVDPSNLTTM